MDIDFSDFDDKKLSSTLHLITATMLEIENGGHRTISSEQIQSLAKRADAYADEVERRGIVAMHAAAMPHALVKQLRARGIKEAPHA